MTIFRDTIKTAHQTPHNCSVSFFYHPNHRQRTASVHERTGVEEQKHHREITTNARPTAETVIPIWKLVHSQHQRGTVPTIITPRCGPPPQHDKLVVCVICCVQAAYLLPCARLCYRRAGGPVVDKRQTVL